MANDWAKKWKENRFRSSPSPISQLSVLYWRIWRESTRQTTRRKAWALADAGMSGRKEKNTTINDVSVLILSLFSPRALHRHSIWLLCVCCQAATRFSPRIAPMSWLRQWQRAARGSIFHTRLSHFFQFLLFYCFSLSRKLRFFSPLLLHHFNFSHSLIPSFAWRFFFFRPSHSPSNCRYVIFVLHTERTCHRAAGS